MTRPPKATNKRAGTNALLDVLVIGAGMAGTGLAHNLHRQGVNVAVVDRMSTYPDAFRAEKIEPAQAVLMRKLGMFEHRVPCIGPIGRIAIYKCGQLTEFDTDDQYGFSYGDTINSLRTNLLHGIELRVGEVVAIHNGPDVQRVQLADGSMLLARLVVLAAGGAGKLLDSVGMTRRYHRSLRSLNVGFDVERSDGQAFPFAGFNYLLDETTHGVDYVTLFRIGERMRVNVFTQWGARNPQLKEMRATPKVGLARYFPDLKDRIGDFEVSSKVQFFLTDCYRVRNVEQPGIVLVADEYQSVCPATGTGLSKVLTDIDLLASDLVPTWLATPGMGVDKIGAYYGHPRKRECDTDSLMRWISYRDTGSRKTQLQWYRVETKLKTFLDSW